MTTKSVSRDTRLMSLDLHPVSTSQTKVQSPAPRVPSNVYYAYDIKNHCAAVGNCCAAFFFATCAAALLGGNIGPPNCTCVHQTFFHAATALNGRGYPLPVLENTYFCVFFKFHKNMTFLRIFEMMYRKVAISQQTFGHQSVKMSSCTSLSEHRNSKRVAR